MNQIITWDLQDTREIPIFSVIQDRFTWRSLVEKILRDQVKDWDISCEQLVLEREVLIKHFGIDIYKEQFKRILWESKYKVSFEDFCEFSDLRNNFRSYFSQKGYFLYEYAYRSQWFYQRFVQNHPDLLRKLISLYNRPDLAFYKEIEEELVLLYRAYELMFEDEEVTMNHQLFG